MKADDESPEATFALLSELMGLAQDGSPDAFDRLVARIETGEARSDGVMRLLAAVAAGVFTTHFGEVLDLNRVHDYASDLSTRLRPDLDITPAEIEQAILRLCGVGELIDGPDAAGALLLLWFTVADLLGLYPDLLTVREPGEQNGG